MLDISLPKVVNKYLKCLPLYQYQLLEYKEKSYYFDVEQVSLFQFFCLSLLEIEFPF